MSRRLSIAGTSANLDFWYRRSTSLDAHRQSISSSASPPNRNLAHPPAPPVVVHSPMKTPRDRPSTSPPPLRVPNPDLSAANEPRPRFANEAQVVGAAPSSPIYRPPGPASPSSPGNFPSRPLAAVSVPTSEASYISPSLASSPSQTPASSQILQPTRQPNAERSPDSPAGAAQVAAQSQASSGISLFGTSVAQGPGGPPQETLEPPRPPPVAAPQPAPAPAGPVFQLPPGLKVRERRRVNIRGLGPLVPISPGENSKEEEKSDPAPAPAPVTTQAQPAPPPAPLSEEDNLAIPTPSRSPASPENDAASSSLFPPRSAYLFRPSRPLPSGQKSALSLLLSSASTATSKPYNPFSRLYQSCISRSPGPDPSTLNLALYFPFSNRPSQPLKIRVKRDVTVEEVIGAGLWAYWEDEGREPKLDSESLGVRVGEAEEGRETTRWNLRIVEEDGEVDEDFPGAWSRSLFPMSTRDETGLTRGNESCAALDRMRNVTTFSFTEFAIVRATGQQGALSDYSFDAADALTACTKQSRTTPQSKPLSSADPLASCQLARQLQEASRLLDDIRPSRRRAAPAPPRPSLRSPAGWTAWSQRHWPLVRRWRFLLRLGLRWHCSTKRGPRSRCRSPRTCTSQICSVRSELLDPTRAL